MVNMKNAMVLAGALLLSACAKNLTTDSQSNTAQVTTVAAEINIYTQPWLLTEMKGQKVHYVDALPKIKFAFDSERKMVYGFSGCNRFSAFYILVADHVNFGSLSGTKMACEKHTQLETDFLRDFKKSNFFEIKGDRLLLLDGKKKLLFSFKAIDNMKP